MRSYLKLNRPHRDRNSSREIPRCIFTFFLIKKNFFLFSFFYFLIYFLIKFPITPLLLLNFHFHFHIFLLFFLIRKIFFFVSLIFLQSPLLPLLLLNFHFHFTITLQKKQEALFLSRTSYIFPKFFCAFVFNIVFLRV